MSNLKKAIILLSLLGLLLTPAPVFAQEAVAPEPVDSFELFWPVVAGKTMGDPLYFLKSLKETVRGWFIFGAPQKADYAVFLATKRVVEAEKLINDGKKDLANKTLDRAIAQLGKAEENVVRVKDKGIPFQDEAVNMSNRLSNLEIFISWLILNFEENKETLSKVLERVESLSATLP